MTILRDIQSGEPGTITYYGLDVEWWKLRETKPGVVLLCIQCPCCDGDGELTFECQLMSGCEHTAECSTCNSWGWCELDREDDGKFYFHGFGQRDEVEVPEEVLKAYNGAVRDCDPNQTQLFEENNGE